MREGILRSEIAPAFFNGQSDRWIRWDIQGIIRKQGRGSVRMDDVCHFGFQSLNSPECSTLMRFGHSKLISKYR